MKKYLFIIIVILFSAGELCSETVQRGYIGRQDLKNWTGTTIKTFTRPTSTGGNQTLTKPGNLVDVLVTHGDGKTYTGAVISSAINEATTTRGLMLSPGTWKITANLTIPSYITFYCPPGCIIDVAAGITLTVDGNIEYGDYDIFTGTGTVSYYKPHRTDERAQFIHSSDTDILIEPGCYFHDGTKPQQVYWNSQLTVTCSNISAVVWQPVYIFLDDSAIVTNDSPLLDNSCFIDSNTAPTWSDSKHGWYTGNDRCIFACTADATQDLLQFYHSGGRWVEYEDKITDLNADTLNTVATDVVLDIPNFGNNMLANCTFMYTYSNAAAYLYYRKNGGTASHVVGGCPAAASTSFLCRDVTVDGDLKIEVEDSAASTNTTMVYTNGFYLPFGM